jgi:hydroxymethylpyrimidine/phosphomethylpyrimidine kinase
MNRPYVLSIAGFDPSAGAGVLADIKTFEQNGVYGFGVVSALTVQNDVEFESVEWIKPEKIIKQIEVLRKRYSIKFIKIGLIENSEVLQRIVSYLHQNFLNPIIIVDPILKATAGFIFNDSGAVNTNGVYCITPNIPEAIALFGNENLEEKLMKQSKKMNIYLKGGHAIDGMVSDILFTDGQKCTFSNARLPNGSKHGSGCVLSSALTAQLALGFDLKTAAKNANDYTNNFLSSNETLLGYHNKQIQYEVN